MGTKYSGESISGYNSSPPADDGTATEANKIKWSTIKGKITDPIKTLAESINTALTTAFDYSAVSKTANYTVTTAEHMKTVECDGTFTVTLGAAASMGAGYITTIKNVGSGTITVDGDGAETIDGDATKSLAQYDSITVAVDSAAGNWNVREFNRNGAEDPTSTEYSYLDATSSIQGQFDAISDRGPTGTVIIWPTASVPTGYLECNGAAVSRTTYAALFSVLSTTYGVGDGSTTFNLPDLRGEFIRGFDNTAGNDPDAASRTDRGDGTTGDNVGTKQATDTQDHSHYIPGVGSGGGVVSVNTSDTSWDSGSDIGRRTHDTLIENSGESRPRNVCMMFCIKT